MSRFPATRFLTSAHKPADFPPDKGREVAFAGRSNAGKSSAINAITGRKGLARTSKTPGRTQLINYFELDQKRRLVDLPGYGFARVPAKVRQHWRRLMEAYFSGRKSLAGVILVVDVRRGLVDFDRQMLDWAMDCGCPTHVLLTKADKLKRGALARTLLEVEQDLAANYADGATASLSLQAFSALDRTGLEDAQAVLGDWLALETAGS